MKTVIRCLNCREIMRFSQSYAIKLTQKTKSFLTGEEKEETIFGRLCRDCAESAGYKVKKLK